jgi:hypothetical protein
MLLYIARLIYQQLRVVALLQRELGNAFIGQEIVVVFYANILCIEHHREEIYIMEGKSTN